MLDLINITKRHVDLFKQSHGTDDGTHYKLKTVPGVAPYVAQEAREVHRTTTPLLEYRRIKAIAIRGS